MKCDDRFGNVSAKGERFKFSRRKKNQQIEEPLKKMWEIMWGTQRDSDE